MSRIGNAMAGIGNGAAAMTAIGDVPAWKMMTLGIERTDCLQRGRSCSLACQTPQLAISQAALLRRRHGLSTARFDPLLGGRILVRRRDARLLGPNRTTRVVNSVSADGAPFLSTEVPEQKQQPEAEKVKVEEELSRVELLWRSFKLPIYSVAIVPLSVGGAAAFWQTGVFNAARYWLMFWSSSLIMLWLNLSNDAYDAETGVDKDKKESIVNITGSQKGVLFASQACLVLGFSGLVLGSSQAGDIRVAVLLAAAIACGYVYQCPPFRLSYKGVGEPLCLLAFGPLATTAFYLSQGQLSGTAGLPITVSIFGTSMLVGISTTLILFCSHFHQIEGDVLAGKMSPLVRLGTETGAKIVQAAIIGLYLLIALLTVVKALPVSCTLFSLFTLPIGKLVLDFIKNNHSDKEVIFMAKYYAVRLHVALGVALTLGFSLVSRLQLPVFG